MSESMKTRIKHVDESWKIKPFASYGSMSWLEKKSRPLWEQKILFIQTVLQNYYFWEKENCFFYKV